MKLRVLLNYVTVLGPCAEHCSHTISIAEWMKIMSYAFVCTTFLLKIKSKSCAWTSQEHDINEMRAIVLNVNEWCILFNTVCVCISRLKCFMYLYVFGVVFSWRCSCSSCAVQGSAKRGACCRSKSIFCVRWCRFHFVAVIPSATVFGVELKHIIKSEHATCLAETHAVYMYSGV